MAINARAEAAIFDELKDWIDALPERDGVARVLEAMLPYFTEQYGNPHSASHAYGRMAAEAIEQARSEIAALIHADPRELAFTSGATEANNLAI